MRRLFVPGSHYCVKYFLVIYKKNVYHEMLSNNQRRHLLGDVLAVSRGCAQDEKPLFYMNQRATQTNTLPLLIRSFHLPRTFVSMLLCISYSPWEASKKAAECEYIYIYMLYERPYHSAVEHFIFFWLPLLYILRSIDFFSSSSLSLMIRYMLYQIDSIEAAYLIKWLSASVIMCRTVFYSTNNEL